MKKRLIDYDKLYHAVMGLMFASEDGFCNHGRRRTGDEIRLD